jgi:hypothetical protein
MGSVTAVPDKEIEGLEIVKLGICGVDAADAAEERVVTVILKN